MKSNLITGKKIAIVGGGPGGLTLARLLQLSGAEVKVYERDMNKDVRVQGATLDLHEESGLKALEKANLMDAFKENYRPGADRTRVVDQDGHIHLDEFGSEDGELFRPEIDRGPLRKLLLESLQADTVVWDSHLASLSPLENNAWKLDFHNGTSAVADLVIAADGANSNIRQLITPLKPFYSGVTIVEGTVFNSAIAAPKMHALLNGGKIFALGGEKTIILSSKGDGSLVFYTGCKTAENWGQASGIDFTDKAQVISWFKQEYAGWNEIWLELFENASTSFALRPQYCMPLDQSWETLPTLTMLGDAAHLMPPYAGEGVNMAMLDALELSECLTDEKFADIQEALSAYEKQMLVRFAEIGQITMGQTEALHAPDAVAHLVEMFRGERPQEV